MSRRKIEGIRAYDISNDLGWNLYAACMLIVVLGALMYGVGSAGYGAYEAFENSDSWEKNVLIGLGSILVAFYILSSTRSQLIREAEIQERNPFR